jgi:hypothetical protein
MSQHVIAVFPTYDVAAKRIDELIRSGISPSRIHVTATEEGIQVAVDVADDQRRAALEKPLA